MRPVLNLLCYAMANNSEVCVSRLITFALFISFVIAGCPVQGQDTGEPPVAPGAAAQFPPRVGDLGQHQPSEAERKLERDREKKLNQERQANLKRDTDKLLQLATQLKQAVDKSNENTLSLEVIKKAGEIEKLAKSVREKMRGEN